MGSPLWLVVRPSYRVSWPPRAPFAETLADGVHACVRGSPSRSLERSEHSLSTVEAQSERVLVASTSTTPWVLVDPVTLCLSAVSPALCPTLYPLWPVPTSYREPYRADRSSQELKVRQSEP